MNKLFTDEFSFSADVEITPELWKKIAPDPPDDMKSNITYFKFVQARKHRKKRINKKWLKKYGYKQIAVTSNGWILKTYTDWTYEFVKDLNGV